MNVFASLIGLNPTVFRPLLVGVVLLSNIAGAKAQCEVDISMLPNWCCTGELKAWAVGVPPITWEWSTGEKSRYKDSACTGTTYYVTMTDSTGCSAIDSVSLPLDTGSVRFSTINAPCSTCTGSIVMHRTTSTCQGGYFADIVPHRPIGSQYTPGTYIITFQDLCGCKVIDTVVVGVDTTVGIGPHPERTSFRQFGNTLYFDQPIKEVRLFDLQGRLVREYAWTRRLDLDDLVPGMYLLHGVLEDGSVAKGKVVIAR